PESDLRFEITLAQAQVMYATVLIQRRKDETAEHFARLGYGTYRRHFGLTTVNSLMAGQNLGAILAAVGKNDEAVEVFRPVLDARRRLLGREHADTLMTTVMLGRSLIALGQEDAGEQYLDQALEIGTEAYRQQNPIGVLASKSLATLYRERGDFDRAIQSAKAAVRFAESRHGKGDWRVEIHRVRLASLFHQVGDAEQAFALSESARQTLISVVGEQHPYARAAATTAKAAREQLVAIE
ncbi:MAG: tetratricopeptide repeat protein, partial [Planctomycetota bacterium]